MNNDLTIAICAFNCEKYIVQTLDSVLNQSFQNFDLVIVDDCSTDNTLDIIKSYFAKKPHLHRLIHFEKNRGLCGGRIWVERNVKTRYLMFIDADDLIYPTYVETLYNKIISDSDIMAVGCYVEYIDSDGEKMGGGIFIGETTKEGFYKKAQKEKLIFSIATSLYNRELALRVGGHSDKGFPEGKPRYQDFCEDLDLWTRMSDLYKEGKVILVVPKILYQYRKHDSAISTNSIGMVLRMRHIKTNLKRRRRGEQELTFVEFREKMGDAEYHRLEKEAIAVDCLRNSYYQLKCGQWYDGLCSLFRSIRNNPLYILNKVKYNILK